MVSPFAMQKPTDQFIFMFTFHFYFPDKLVRGFELGRLN